jgi:predicted ATPase
MDLELKSIEFKNFKVLRNATLPLGRFNLLVGPNGSGKSTALASLGMMTSCAITGRSNALPPHSQVVSSGVLGQAVSVGFSLQRPASQERVRLYWPSGAPGSVMEAEFSFFFKSIRMYSLDADQIALSVPLDPNLELSRSGRNLAAVLDQMRDAEPERFRSLNDEIGRLLPEYDQILFETPGPGQRSFLLRTRVGGHRITAQSLSHGTLFAVALLTIAHNPNPPTVLGIEDPDKGIHPRLLRGLRDALYRLSYPENYGESREPVQVIATTHSPYMLDLYRDHPEEVVIAEKGSDGATFERPSDRTDLDEILGDANLGDVWYSGILGGVPANR